MLIRFYLAKQQPRYYVGRKTQERYVDINGTYKDAVDITNPSIVVDISDNANITGTTEDIAFFKYYYAWYNQVMILDRTSRQYFVTKVVELRKNLLQFDLHVDLLQTFYPFILKQNAFVSRNENRYNIKLPDERRIVLNQSTTDITEIQNVPNSKVNITFNPNQYNTRHIVANLGNKGASKGMFENFGTLLTPATILENIPKSDYSYYDRATLFPRAMFPSALGDLLYEAFNDSSLATYIGSIYSYPFEIPASFNSGGADTPLILGNSHIIKDVNGNNVNAWSITSISNELIISHFKLEESAVTDFNDLEPYSQYEIYIPYYGWKQINYNSLLGHELIVFYIVNFSDGTSMVYLYDDTEKNIIFSSACNLGVEIPKDVSNAKEVRDRSDANRMNLTLNLIGSMLSVVGGIVTENPVAVAGGVLNATRSVGQTYQNQKTNYNRAQVQFSGNSISTISPHKVYLRKTKTLIQYSLTSDFLKYNGGVLNEQWSLNNIHGYTEIAHIEFTEFPNDAGLPVTGMVGIDKELDEIKILLKNGVYFS